MNKIPIIRKGSYKDYLSNGIGGGFIIGIMFFLVSLPINSITDSLMAGLAFWFVIIFIFMGIGFPSNEYLKRKIKIKKLYSNKYSFLDENSFVLHEDLYFDGIYNDFHFRVIPMTKLERYKKNFEYVIIETYYTYDSEQYDFDKLINLCGDSNLGKLYLMNHLVQLFPIDLDPQDFNFFFGGLIKILKSANLKPLSKNDWENMFLKTINETVKEDEESRTKQILKIGKLDLKYIKPGKKKH